MSVNQVLWSAWVHQHAMDVLAVAEEAKSPTVQMALRHIADKMIASSNSIREANDDAPAQKEKKGRKKQ